MAESPESRSQPASEAGSPTSSNSSWANVDSDDAISNLGGSYHDLASSPPPVQEEIPENVLPTLVPPVLALSTNDASDGSIDSFSPISSVDVLEVEHEVEAARDLHAPPNEIAEPFVPGLGILVQLDEQDADKQSAEASTHVSTVHALTDLNDDTHLPGPYHDDVDVAHPSNASATDPASNIIVTSSEQVSSPATSEDSDDEDEVFRDAADTPPNSDAETGVVAESTTGDGIPAARPEFDLVETSPTDLSTGATTTLTTEPVHATFSTTPSSATDTAVPAVAESTSSTHPVASTAMSTAVTAPATLSKTAQKKLHKLQAAKAAAAAAATNAISTSASSAVSAGASALPAAATAVAPTDTTTSTGINSSSPVVPPAIASAKPATATVSASMTAQPLSKTAQKKLRKAALLASATTVPPSVATTSGSGSGFSTTSRLISLPDFIPAAVPVKAVETIPVVAAPVTSSAKALAEHIPIPAPQPSQEHDALKRRVESLTKSKVEWTEWLEHVEAKRERATTAKKVAKWSAEIKEAKATLTRIEGKLQVANTKLGEFVPTTSSIVVLPEPIAHVAAATPTSSNVPTTTSQATPKAAAISSANQPKIAALKQSRDDLKCNVDDAQTNLNRSKTMVDTAKWFAELTKREDQLANAEAALQKMTAELIASVPSTPAVAVQPKPSESVLVAPSVAAIPTSSSSSSPKAVPKVSPPGPSPVSTKKLSALTDSRDALSQNLKAAEISLGKASSSKSIKQWKTKVEKCAAKLAKAEAALNAVRSRSPLALSGVSTATSQPTLSSPSSPMPPVSSTSISPINSLKMRIDISPVRDEKEIARLTQSRGDLKKHLESIKVQISQAATAKLLAQETQVLEKLEKVEATLQTAKGVAPSPGSLPRPTAISLCLTPEAVTLDSSSSEVRGTSELTQPRDDQTRDAREVKAGLAAACTKENAAGSNDTHPTREPSSPDTSHPGGVVMHVVNSSPHTIPTPDAGVCPQESLDVPDPDCAAPPDDATRLLPSIEMSPTPSEGSSLSAFSVPLGWSAPCSPKDASERRECAEKELAQRQCQLQNFLADAANPALSVDTSRLAEMKILVAKAVEALERAKHAPKALASQARSTEHVESEPIYQSVKEGKKREVLLPVNDIDSTPSRISDDHIIEYGPSATSPEATGELAAFRTHWRAEAPVASPALSTPAVSLVSDPKLASLTTSRNALRDNLEAARRCLTSATTPSSVNVWNAKVTKCSLKLTKAQKALDAYYLDAYYPAQPVESVLPTAAGQSSSTPASPVVTSVASSPAVASTPQPIVVPAVLVAGVSTAPTTTFSKPVASLIDSLNYWRRAVPEAEANLADAPSEDLRKRWEKTLKKGRKKLAAVELAFGRIIPPVNVGPPAGMPSPSDVHEASPAHTGEPIESIPSITPPVPEPEALPVIQGQPLDEDANEAYEDAVAYMTEYMASPPKEPTTSERLQTAQALLLELGVFSRPEDLPRSVTAARKIFFEVVHLNILDYYALRSRGMGALRSAMHDTKKALRADLRKRRAALQEVKALGLRDLLAPRGGA